MAKRQTITKVPSRPPLQGPSFRRQRDLAGAMRLPIPTHVEREAITNSGPEHGASGVDEGGWGLSFNVRRRHMTSGHAIACPTSQPASSANMPRALVGRVTGRSVADRVPTDSAYNRETPCRSCPGTADGRRSLSRGAGVCRSRSAGTALTAASREVKSTGEHFAIGRQVTLASRWPVAMESRPSAAPA
jgi:hypothetical protein